MKKLLIVLAMLIGINCYAADSIKIETISAVDANAYYPLFSKRNGQQGTAVCRIFFDETGIVEQVEIVTSSGYSRLDLAASEICKRHQIKPVIINNTPVKIRTDYGIRFKLPDIDPALLPFFTCKDCTWGDKIIRKVRANITFNADSFKGDKQTIIRVRLAPDGEILSRTLTQSSGDKVWDQAILDAVDATQSFPKDDNGQFPTLAPELKVKPR